VAGDNDTHGNTQTHIDPHPPLSGNKQSFPKIFYSLEFVDIKSRRRYGWISYEESVGEEDRDSRRH
jgi:hypothetical protein